MTRIFHRCPWLAGLLFLLALAPAWGETPSQQCVAAIKNADTAHRPNLVPRDCWRLGPLRLGMSLVSARNLLGAPDAAQDLSISYRRRKYPLTRLFYVYPRNLRNWLRLAPVAEKNFHAITMRLDFSRDVLSAVTVDDNVRTTLAACVPGRAGHGFVRSGADFPYGFHGLTLGASLASAQSRFGAFSAPARGNDVHPYWPVPLSLEGGDTVSGIRFALSQAFENGGGFPLFQPKLDPQSCLITGFAMTAGH